MGATDAAQTDGDLTSDADFFEPRWGLGEVILMGDAAAGELAQRFGVTVYEFSFIAGVGIEIRPFGDDGEALGRILMTTDGIAMLADLDLANGEGASLTFETRGLAEGLTGIRRRIEADSSAFETLASGQMGEESSGLETLEYSATFTPRENLTTPAVGQLINNGDGVWAQVRVLEDGEMQLGESELEQWLDQTGAAPLLDRPSVTLLMTVMGDPTLSEGLYQAFGTLGFDPETIHLNQALCGMVFSTGMGAAGVCCPPCVTAIGAMPVSAGLSGVIAIPTCVCCAIGALVSLQLLLNCVWAQVYALEQADCDREAQQAGRDGYVCAVSDDRHSCDCGCDEFACFNDTSLATPPQSSLCSYSCVRDQCEASYARCGDGIITTSCPLDQTSAETCDWANGSGRGGCREGLQVDCSYDCQCERANCGNGEPDEGEACDFRILDTEQQGCDPGMRCNTDCQCVWGPSCLNGRRDRLERCDPSATPSGCDPNETCDDDCESCRRDPPNNSGTSGGDPHIVTFGRVAFDFQAAGEFVFVESLDAPDPVLVHIRQETLSDSPCPGVTYNSAVATQVGSARVAFYADDVSNIWIDGEPNTLEVGGGLSLSSGGALSRTGSGSYRVEWANGSALWATATEGWLNVGFEAGVALTGRVRGLLGTPNGVRSDELITRSGVILEPAVSADDLYGVYADSYRITAEESLFDYDVGESTDAFQNRTVPLAVTTSRNLSAELRGPAEETCLEAGVIHPDLLEACILDVACSGDPSQTAWATGARPPVDALSVAWPVTFADWTVEGDPANGSWSPDADQRSIRQSSNGDPTFFVGPDDLLDVAIEGTLTVEDTSDDDIVGFVFGYGSPLAERDDEVDDFDFLLVSWKSVTQTFDSVTSAEGLSLVEVSGPVTSVLNTFWGQGDELPNYRVLDTDYGPDRGWGANTEHRFRLVYRAEHTQVWIDEALVFTLHPEALGLSAFAPGRFGFYNYSQPGVVYSDFAITYYAPNP